VGTSDCDSKIAMSRPARGEAGLTGDWRNKRPVMDRELCVSAKRGEITCQLCWVYCPDGCIGRGIGPVIELEYCKGCGICAEMCPAGAIEMQPEAQHGVCALSEEDR